MEATKRLRVATRQDRDTIDTLSDENTVLKMRNRRLESEREKCRAANGAVKAEIRTSLERERRLLSELRRVGGLSGSE